MRTISEQELKDILSKHDEWLKDNNKGQRANLRSADLRYANLSSANLSYANLSSANLSSADLRYANLRSADLRYANLSSADLRYANLRYANLSSANLSSANLRSADLRYANLRSANLSYANLLAFQFQMSWAYFTFDGTLRIGCECMPITEWMLGYQQIGKKHGYSELQIEMYGAFIKQCHDAFNAGKFKPQSKEK